MSNAPVPTRLSRYEIGRVIGQGATSTVYLATDTFSGNQVAVKCHHVPGGSEDDLSKRQRSFFINEAALAGKLIHPHIVSVLDAGHEEHFYFIVMEYVNGPSLKKFCSPENLLSVDAVLEIAFKCCMALDYSTKRGIIHRDIKPANILVAGKDDVKITDFGCSILVADTATVATGVGSPAYMSPEQVSDKALTFHTDMYSLGVVLFQLLTGQLPFQAENHFALSYKIINEPAPLVSSLRADLPSGLDELIATALEKQPGKRYPTWAAFGKAIAALINKLDFPENYIPDTEKFQALKKLHFFRKFADAELWEVLHAGQWRRTHKGAVLIQEGEEGDSFFVLAKGGAAVLKGGVVIGTLQPGDCVGEMSLLSDGKIPRSATVQAMTDVTLLSIQAHQVALLSEKCQLALSKAFLEVLVLRVLAGNLKLAEMARSGARKAKEPLV